MKSTVTSKGQTTIPKAVRERLNLGQGAEIDWVLQPGGQALTVSRAEPIPNPFQTMLGAFPLPAGLTPGKLMEEIRGERDPQLTAGASPLAAVTVDMLLRQLELQE